ncbi:DUF1697 domain-containing protein [Cellulophaga sp. Hel_I_12]|uniref:DUF1697 domain-containing protein n=1 Tax=Cellulophaga sp. Hel_I_12 TaxID=1249972 RepID=UPI00064647AD|nr:DUF1697 domain-containing protein [Cellulophaga sp. Hel_I_12]
MKTYLLFLRGINVSGHKKIKMTDLKHMLERIGMQNVQTYIQSGNIVLKVTDENVQILEKKVSEVITRNYGFEVPVLVLELSNFNEIVHQSPFSEYNDLEKKHAYFVLLKNKPETQLIQALEEEKYPNETFKITQNCIYLTCKNGYGNAKCNTNFFERKLKVQATTRNYKTMSKLVAMTTEY